MTEQGSRLLMEVFNRMTHKQKASVPDDLSREIGSFMVENGYRFVFDRWYLQEKPTSSDTTKKRTRRPFR